MSPSLPTLAIIGGTGALGSGLARRWARAGYPVIVGSRSAEKAAAAAAGLAVANGTVPARGLVNAAAAAAAGIIVVAVPFASQRQTLSDIRDGAAGKIVIDTTVPLVPPKVGTVQLPPEGSAAMIAQRLLGDGAIVVSAFHNVAAHKLQRDEAIDCDVLVFGDKKEARETVIGLARALGLRGLHGGPLANSAAAEALTSILITINRIYKVDGAGLRVTGELGGTTVT
ncbi:MAG: NADPH-dependent F420 reductase [Proteobacteria bacterium]|nr:NADPH-dependent F420 reductase [Pseudomonadota bacterium]